MARDFEDIHDLDDLNGEELQTVVRELLAQHVSLDVDALSVRVDHRIVVLGGRVGTEAQRLIAEHVVTDQLGVECRNEIVVDANYRSTNPDAADEAELTDREVGFARAEGADDGTLAAERDEDSLDSSLFGTTDAQSAVEDGTPWNPPDAPTAEGINESGEIGEGR